MKFRMFLLAIFVVSLSLSYFAEIKPIRDFTQAFLLGQVEEKKVIIMFASPYCGWCRKFERDNFKNAEVEKLVKNNYIFAEIYADPNKKVKLGDKVLNYAQLFSYFRVRGTPTIWFFEPTGRGITYIPGYVPPATFSKILRYISEEAYKKVKWDEYKEDKNYFGEPKLVKLGEREYEFILDNDPYVILLENEASLTSLDRFGRYVVRSESLAKKMIEDGFYNVFLFPGEKRSQSTETKTTTPSTYIEGW